MTCTPTTTAAVSRTAPPPQTLVLAIGTPTTTAHQKLLADSSLPFMVSFLGSDVAVVTALCSCLMEEGGVDASSLERLCVCVLCVVTVSLFYVALGYPFQVCGVPSLVQSSPENLIVVSTRHSMMNQDPGVVTTVRHPLPDSF
jgi:hypothetical protein